MHISTAHYYSQMNKFPFHNTSIFYALIIDKWLSGYIMIRIWIPNSQIQYMRTVFVQIYPYCRATTPYKVYCIVYCIVYYVVVHSLLLSETYPLLLRSFKFHIQKCLQRQWMMRGNGSQPFFSSYVPVMWNITLSLYVCIYIISYTFINIVNKASQHCYSIVLSVLYSISVLACLVIFIVRLTLKLP